jgi:hypothetical protein
VPVVALASLAVVLVLLLVGTLIARRSGYNLGGEVIARCSAGHLFTTIWVPGVSFKAIRLGWMRFQRCPVGDHWSIVVPVKDSDLTDEQRRSAARSRDSGIP